MDRIKLMVKTGNVPSDQELKKMFLVLCKDYLELKKQFTALEKDYLNHIAEFENIKVEFNPEDHIQMSPNHKTMKSNIRQFINKYCTAMIKSDSDPKGYIMGDEVINILEKELTEAIEKDGFITADNHNLLLSKAIEQAYDEGLLAGPDTIIQP